MQAVAGGVFVCLGMAAVEGVVLTPGTGVCEPVLVSDALKTNRR